MMIVIHIITIIVIRIRAIMCCICAAIICFKLAFKSASLGGVFLGFESDSFAKSMASSETEAFWNCNSGEQPKPLPLPW